MSAKHLHLSWGAAADPGHRGPRSSEKGLPDADAAHLRMTRVRLQQLFGRLDARGATFKVGRGTETQRGLKPLPTL